jgi:hypothetical protein
MRQGGSLRRFAVAAATCVLVAGLASAAQARDPSGANESIVVRGVAPFLFGPAQLVIDASRDSRGGLRGHWSVGWRFGIVTCLLVRGNEAYFELWDNPSRWTFEIMALDGRADATDQLWPAFIGHQQLWRPRKDVGCSDFWDPYPFGVGFDGDITIHPPQP